MGMDLKHDGSDDAAKEKGDALRCWVVEALRLATMGDTDEYQNLISSLIDIQLDDAASDSSLKILVKALSESVSFINETNHEALLSTVLGMSFWMHSLEVADALVEFLVNLATANLGCLWRCVDMLVRNFLPPSCGLPIFIDSYSRRAFIKGWSKESLFERKAGHMAKKDDVLSRVHNAIEHLTQLVPMTQLHLQRIVLQRMPHRIVDKEWNALYLKNMLHLETLFSGEFIGSQMLMGVIDRLIEIDVEIRWEDIVGEDESNKAGIFDMDLDEEEQEDSAIDPAVPAIEVQFGLISNPMGSKKQNLGAIADKMDMLMDITLAHLESCAANGRSEQVFKTLMKSFQSTILDTYKSKFTQFLIFYMCSHAPTTCGADFASVLLEILTCKQRPSNSRMSAAAYLASFLARAKYLPSGIVSSSLKKLVEWCVNYIPRQNDKACNLNPDIGANGVFYAACQAVLYVLCFRMNRLLNDPNEASVLRCLPLERLINHNLDPLKLCLPSVVEEFIKQARSARLLKDFSSIELSEKIELQPPVTFGGNNRLDMFFPFDPYLLKRSDRFIRPNFIFWSMVQFQEDDEFENDRQGTVLEGHEDDSSIYSQHTFATTPVNDSEKKHINEYDFDDREYYSEDEDELGTLESLNHMSISPGLVSEMPARLTTRSLLYAAKLLSS